MVSIIHGLYCPGTPEHHIVEIGLNLLAHSKLTSPFWTHAFATTAYIINRLPTPLLKFQTPYTLVYGSMVRNHLTLVYVFLVLFVISVYPLWAGQNLTLKAPPVSLLATPFATKAICAIIFSMEKQLSLAM